MKISKKLITPTGEQMSYLQQYLSCVQGLGGHVSSRAPALFFINRSSSTNHIHTEHFSLDVVFR